MKLIGVSTQSLTYQSYSGEIINRSNLEKQKPNSKLKPVGEYLLDEPNTEAVPLAIFKASLKYVILGHRQNFVYVEQNKIKGWVKISG